MDFSNGIGTRSDSPIKRILVGSTTLDIPTTGAQSVYDFTFTVTGAAVGDIVQLGVTLLGSASDAVRVFNAWVSAANTVKVRMATGGLSANPSSTTFTALVFKV